MSEQNKSAFPLTRETMVNETGLTKRELFAAMAMQGILACPMSREGLAALDAIEREKGNEEILRLTANSAVKYADALLRELAKGGER